MKKKQQQKNKSQMTKLTPRIQQRPNLPIASCDQEADKNDGLSALSAELRREARGFLMGLDISIPQKDRGA